MHPSDQRFDAGDLAGREAGLGLVVQDELVLLDGAAQLARQGELAPARRVLPLRVHLDPGLQRLGQVHGRVGPLEQRVRVEGVLGEAGDADAGLHAEADRLEVERLAQRVEEARGGVPGCHQADEIGKEDGELVAAQPAHGVDLPYVALEPDGDSLEEHVADLVAERVVDLLEPVEVDDEHGQDAAVAPASGGRLLQPVEQQRPVGKTGQRVVEGVALAGERRAGAPVDREQRKGEERQHRHRRAGRHHGHGRQRDEHAGRRRLEADVTGQVPAGLQPPAQRHGQPVEQVADEEQDGAGEQDRAKGASRDRNRSGGQPVARADRHHDPGHAHRQAVLGELEQRPPGPPPADEPADQGGGGDREEGRRQPAGQQDREAEGDRGLHLLPGAVHDRRPHRPQLRKEQEHGHRPEHGLGEGAAAGQAGGGPAGGAQDGHDGERGSRDDERHVGVERSRPPFDDHSRPS